MMDFNKRGFDAFRSAVKKALEPVAEEFDVNIDTGNISYNEFDFKLKLEVSKKTLADGRSAEQAKFEADCMYSAFKPEHYNATFTHKGDTWTLVSFNWKARKYPMNCRRKSDGKTYRFQESFVKRMLKLDDPAKV
jgi:hypothetical protein